MVKWRTIRPMLLVAFFLLLLSSFYTGFRILQPRYFVGDVADSEIADTGVNRASSVQGFVANPVVRIQPPSVSIFAPQPPTSPIQPEPQSRNLFAYGSSQIRVRSTGAVTESILRFGECGYSLRCVP